jgi:hypothetical protein
LLGHETLARGALAPASGTFTEKRIRAAKDGVGALYEYNAELKTPFAQKPDTVYWLKIVALIDPDPAVAADKQMRWGWQNRDFTLTDPFASPNVLPGEEDQAPAGSTFPIWHFQDDAVSGVFQVSFVNADRREFPDIAAPLIQENIGPTKYIAGLDGPGLIGDFSKDLAFELYYVPAPTSGALVTAVVLGWLAFRARRARGERLG